MKLKYLVLFEPTKEKHFKLLKYLTKKANFSDKINVEKLVSYSNCDIHNIGMDMCK